MTESAATDKVAVVKMRRNMVVKAKRRASDISLDGAHLLIAQLGWRCWSDATWPRGQFCASTWIELKFESGQKIGPGSGISKVSDVAAVTFIIYI